MQIKSCSINDIPTLVEISVQSYREHYTYLWTDDGENYIRKNFTAEQFEREFAGHNTMFFLIEVSAKPVGILKINTGKWFDNTFSANSLELERLYFIRAATGKGYGKAAINFVINLAKEKNKTIVWLKTMEDSAAPEFYKLQGFITCSHTTLDYPYIREQFRQMLVLTKDV